MAYERICGGPFVSGLLYHADIQSPAGRTFMLNYRKRIFNLCPLFRVSSLPMAS